MVGFLAVKMICLEPVLLQQIAGAAKYQELYVQEFLKVPQFVMISVDRASHQTGTLTSQATQNCPTIHLFATQLQ